VGAGEKGLDRQIGTRSGAGGWDRSSASYMTASRR